jgi:Putative beta-barrel porin-2, OmpL-like. bbp2
MTKIGWVGLPLVLLASVAAAAVQAADDLPPRNLPPRNLPPGNLPSGNASLASKGSSSKKSLPSSNDSSSSKDSSSKKKAPPNCRAPDAPYRDYKCLDAYLGVGFLERLINYYRLESGHEKAPEDPDAPKSRRSYWPDAPSTTPPYPFVEWPYGGATPIGVTRPNSVDSPLMVALGNTEFGQMLKEDHLQIYGWVNGGGNLSDNTVRPGGNYPASYYYTPTRDQLEQAVVYFERLPDTVQTDHVDWGFRISALYGETYRYTTAFGLANYQLSGHDLFDGYDFPMLYGEVYMPQFAQGLIVRFGRYISIPDIEQQLAPNNYLYSHSLTYSFDNFTNTGIIGTLAVNRNWTLQFGVTCGTDTMCWNIGARVPNPFPNPVFSDATMPRDPGAQLSYTAGARWQSDSGRDALYVVENGINNGTWGYNNLQWTGLTWFHKFAPDWHLSFETYLEEQRNVLNITDPLGIIARGGYPFSPANGFNFNAPFFAQCSNAQALTCTARVFASLIYLNHQFSPLDNLTFRAEYYDDMQGQRTGTKTGYIDFAIGWQHWFSPQIELRPEVGIYYSLNAPAFNGNFNASPVILPHRRDALIAAEDLIWHF